MIVAVFFVIASAWFNYFAFAEWKWGQTIGKNATGIEVRSIDRAPKLSFYQASIRNLLRLIDWFVIGELMIATGARKQRLGDKAANTVVLRRPPRTAAIAGGGPASPPAKRPAPKPEPKPKRRLPVPPWTAKDTAWGLVGGFLLVLIIPSILVAPFIPSNGSVDDIPDGALLASQAVFDGILLAVAVGMASGWRFRPLGRALERLGLRSFRPSAIGIALGALLAYYVFVGLFASLVLEPKQEDIGGDLGVTNPSVAIAIAAIFSIVVIAPVAEELFFRGFLFAGLRGKWSLWPAALLSGLIFGLVHITTGITTVVPLAVLGVGLCWLYDRTGSLWPCMLAHAINNGLALAVVT